MVDNEVDIGDKVLICGLFGDEFNHLNNKQGIVNKIIFTSSQNYSTYIVDVRINNVIHSVNLAYVYRLEDLKSPNHNFDFINENFLDQYINKFNIINMIPLIDMYGKSYLFCQTRENNRISLTLTNLN